MTWFEVDALDRDRCLVFLTVSPLEQHGPHLPLGVDFYGAEWMTFPVPFLSYEHLFWPPAMAAACTVVERLKAGDARARRVAQLFGRGDLDLSYQMLREIGVDMASPEPYEAVVRRMDALNRELEDLLRNVPPAP